MKIFKVVIITFATISLAACGGKEKKEQPAPIYESERGSGTSELTEANKLKLGEEIFNGKGTCNSCHQADKKIIGPSVQEIMEIYSKDGADIISFLKGNEEPIVDPAQFLIMQANLSVTKKMSDVELESLVLYMKSM